MGNKHGVWAVCIAAALGVVGWAFTSIQGLEVRVAVLEAKLGTIVAILERVEDKLEDR